MDPPTVNLKALTEGIHSKEALELVREHLLQIMGPMENAYSTAYVKMSKFQMAQASTRDMTHALLEQFALWCRNILAKCCCRKCV